MSSRGLVPLRRAYEVLDATIDPGRWWPADTRFEIFVGALLTHNTAWANVERSLGQLRAAGLLDAASLSDVSEAELQELIRPSGFMVAKARYLQGAARWFGAHDDGARLLPDGPLRRRLLELSGVGFETADVLLLYAYERPAFVFDAYARRMISAIGGGAFRSYPAAQRALGGWVDDAALSVAELARLHGLIVEAGKRAGPAGWPALWAELSSTRETTNR